MKGIAEEAGPSESAAFVSWVFYECLLRIPSLELCGVSNPTVGHLRWRPFYSPWRCVKPLCRAIFALTVCFDGDSSSPAWNVAGRKMARCQQRWQSLAESLDGAETQPVIKEERCREVLISSHFPASVIICSVWLIYRLVRTSWNVNNIKVFDHLAVLRSIWGGRWTTTL